MVLVFKFQFGEEIRRVTAERELDFNEVVELAKTLFRTQLPAAIALKYKDDEGDIITVGTQRELEEAYRVTKDKILRFIITEGKIPVPQDSSASSIPSDIVQLLESTLKQVSQTPNGIQMFLSSLLTPPPSSPISVTASDNTSTNATKQPESPKPKEPEITITVDYSQPPVQELPSEKPLHPARCDSCQKQIRGIRYKCKDCPDFDLCEVCEPSKIAIHSSQHTFSKILKPAMVKKSEPEPPKTQPTPPPQYQAPATDKPENPQPADNKEASIQENKPQENVVVEPQPTQPVETPKTPVPEKPIEVQQPQPSAPSDIPKPTTPKDSPKVELKKPELFADQQRKLEDMGFTDKSRNVALLIQENGNLLEVVKHLLDG